MNIVQDVVPPSHLTGKNFNKLQKIEALLVSIVISSFNKFAI